jgi:hypothetical protein
MGSRADDPRQATPTRVILLAAAAGIALALLAAACGSGSPSQRTSSASALPPAIKFAQCMRSSGVTNWPDPSSNGRPQPLNQIDPNSPAFHRAYTACRKNLPSGGIGPPTPTAAQLRFALAFAKCMRKHGFPQFPDPLTTYGPGFTLGRGEYFPPISSAEVGSPGHPPSPTFSKAAKTCGLQLPPRP